MIRPLRPIALSLVLWGGWFLPGLALVTPVAAQTSMSQNVGDTMYTVVGSGSVSSQTTGSTITLTLGSLVVEGTEDSVTIGDVTVDVSGAAEVRIEEAPLVLRIYADGALVHEMSRLDELLARAEAGDEVATGVLALAFLDGDGVAQDAARGEQMLRGLAESGHARAAWILAERLFDGDVIAQDKAEARVWAERAVTGGETGAEALLGEMLLHGKGGPEDTERALPLLESAAGRGDMWGELHLGLAYGIGIGVEVDLERAADLYRRSAEQGALLAIRNLVAIAIDSGFAVVPYEEALANLAILDAESHADAAYLRQQVEEVRAGEERAGADDPPVVPEAAVYYYADGRDSVGPMTLTELRALLAGGGIGAATLIWGPDFAAWTPAADVAELAP